MQAFADNGFRGQEFEWLNIMRMAIKAISLADIVTADGTVITYQSYLLKHSNGLRDSFDWPRSPPGEWSTAFTNLWVRALKRCFIASFGIPTSRTLLQAAKLGSWSDHSVIDKWNCFYSDTEDRIFCKTKWGWEFFVHSARGKYCLSAFTSETRPTPATKMITLSHRNILVIPEKPLSPGKLYSKILTQMSTTQWII